MTLVVSSIDAAKGQLARAFAVTRRWDLLRALAGQGPLAMHEVVRRVGRVVFPYDAVHVDFSGRGRKKVKKTIIPLSPYTDPDSMSIEYSLSQFPGAQSVV